MAKKMLQTRVSILSILNLICFPPLLLLVIFAVILIVIVSALIYLWRYIVKIGLQLKYGKRFMGLVDYGLKMFTVDLTETYLNVVYIVETKRISFDEFYKNFRNVLNTKFSLYNTSKKASSQWRKFCGVYYLLESKCRVLELIKQIEIEEDFVDRETVNSVVSKYENEKIPLTGNFKIQVFNKPLKTCKQDTKKRKYCVLIRINHALGDGLSLMSFVSKLIPDEKVLYLDKLPAEKKETKHRIGSVLKLLISATQIIFEYIPKLNHPLPWKQYTGKHLIDWKIEEKTEFVPFIKQQRLKMKGHLRFSHVIHAAISASLSNYLEQKFGTIPVTHYSVYSTALFRFPYDIGTELSNNFSHMLFSIPCFSSSTMDPLDRLINVKKAFDSMYNPNEVLVNHWINRIVGILPNSISPLINPYRGLTTISVVPGMDKEFGVLNGDVLKDMLFWIPIDPTNAITFAILTHGNRFQIGLTIDESLVSKQEDTQIILRGIFDYLRQLKTQLS